MEKYLDENKAAYDNLAKRLRERKIIFAYLGNHKNIRSLMKTMKLTAKQAMDDALQVFPFVNLIAKYKRR